MQMRFGSPAVRVHEGYESLYVLSGRPRFFLS
jgi:hypothetical protein